MEPMDPRSLISHYCKGKMSSRPEFYSGRGATISDLDSIILEMVYQGVLKEKGPEAAKNFVALVDRIQVLSATGFLNAFYQWYNNDCPEPKSTNPNDIDMPVGVDYNSTNAMACGFGTIISAMNRGERDDTWSIKFEFLRHHSSEHKIEITDDRYSFRMMMGS